MKVIACVVLYNPDDMMLGNILSYYYKINELIIIDNSPVRSDFFYHYFKDESRTEYVFFGENLGIATALNTACRLALDKGYNWILTMDQDSRFVDDSFFSLLQKGFSPEVAIYAASYTDVFGRWLKPYDSDFNEIHFAISSGNLLHLSKWEEVEGFEDKLFIDEVDHDFCLKLRLKKYKILTSREILLSHTVGVKDSVNLTNKSKTSSRPQPIRFYYITRNGLYIIKRYFIKDFWFAGNRLFYFGKAILRIIFLYPDKTQYLKYLCLGIKDFFRSRYGRL